MGLKAEDFPDRQSDAHVRYILPDFESSRQKAFSLLTDGARKGTFIDTDFILSRPESFYDRPALAEYIHTLK